MAKVNVNSCLRIQVANLQAVAFRALECHWNVSGVHFGPLHALFGDSYEELLAIQDTVAERVRALNGAVPITLGALKMNSELADQSFALSGASDMLEALLAGYTLLIECGRGAITAIEPTDCVTANMLQDIVAKYEKRAWMIRMHLRTTKES